MFIVIPDLKKLKYSELIDLLESRHYDLSQMLEIMIECLKRINPDG